MTTRTFVLSFGSGGQANAWIRAQGYEPGVWRDGVRYTTSLGLSEYEGINVYKWETK